MISRGEQRGGRKKRRKKERKEGGMKDVTKLSANVLARGQMGDLVSHRSGHVTVCFLPGQRQLSLVTGDSTREDRVV